MEWLVTVPPARPGGRSAQARIPVEGSVEVGRESPLRTPLDEGVSRHALTVHAGPAGWEVEIVNRNGASVHPRGLAPVTRPGRVWRSAWPQVGIRLHNGRPGEGHWVLLETTALDYPEPGVPPAIGGSTDLTVPPRPLAPAETKALRALFAPQLAWPPSLDEPRTIAAAGAITFNAPTSVSDSLDRAQEKALKLGLAARVNDRRRPDYLHVLVAAGYLRPDAD